LFAELIVLFVFKDAPTARAVVEHSLADTVALSQAIYIYI